MALEPGYEFEIKNINLGAALSEKSFAVRDAKKIQISCRDSSDSPVSFRIATMAGGTQVGPYSAMSAGVVIFEADIKLTQQLWFASMTENAVIEVLIWK